MGAALSVCSSLRVRAQKEVCAASCTGHECYKGSAAAPGCPMFSHALFLSSGQHCKLCMQCLRSCPSHSPRLVLQLPLCDIWRSDMLNVEMAPLTVAVALMALLMAAGHAWHRAGTPHDWWVTGVSLGAVAIGWVFWRALVGRRGSERGGSVTWSARVMFAYAPLVGGLLFACHLGAIGWLGAVMLTAAAPGGGGVSVSALWVVQALAGATGLLFTAVALAKVARARTITAARAAPLAVALSGLAAAYLVAGLWLLR